MDERETRSLAGLDARRASGWMGDTGLSFGLLPAALVVAFLTLVVAGWLAALVVGAVLSAGLLLLARRR
jgi:uncharacterized membrane protein